MCVFFDQFCKVGIKNYKEFIKSYETRPQPLIQLPYIEFFCWTLIKWHKNHWPNRINQLVPVTTSYDGESLDHPEVSHRRSQISNFLMISLMLTGGGKKKSIPGTPCNTSVVAIPAVCIQIHRQRWADGTIWRFHQTPPSPPPCQ